MGKTESAAGTVKLVGLVLSSIMHSAWRDVTEVAGPRGDIGELFETDRMPVIVERCCRVERW
jgi:hypothetical protein